jgi:hypothetical protein
MDWVITAVMWTILISGPSTIALFVWLDLRRARRFSRRPAPTFEEWYQEQCPGGDLDREALRVVLQALAEALDVVPTQFRLSDAFDGEFRWFPEWVGIPDEVRGAVRRLVKHFGVADWKWPPPPGTTLGDFLTEISKASQQQTV